MTNRPQTPLKQKTQDELEIDAEFAALEAILREEACRLARENPEMEIDAAAINLTAHAAILEATLRENSDINAAELPEMKSFAADWVNEPQEELDGLTPLEAVKTDEYKADVENMLRDMECLPDGLAKKLMQPIVADMRTLLGLSSKETK